MNYPHIFRRFVLPVMLVAVLGNVLPTHPAQASSRGPAPSTAVAVPAVAVRDILWVATAQLRLAAAQRPELAAFALVLQQLYRETPTLAPTTAVQKIQTLESIYSTSGRADESRTVRTANESLFAVFATLTASPLTASPAGSAVARAARQSYSLTLGQPAGGDPFGDDRIAAASELQFAPFDDVLRTILTDSVTQEHQNANFRAAFDLLWAADFHTGINSTTSAIIQSSPALQALPAITQLIRPDGTIQSTLGDLDTLVQAQFTGLEAVITSARAMLVTLDKAQKDVVAAAADTPAHAAAKAAAELAATAAQARIDKAKAGLEVLGKVIGKVDPQASKVVSVVGGALIKVAEAVNTYTTAVAGLGTLDALASLSTVAMTGNVIGAVMTIFSLFAKSGPSPEQMILEEIGKLRQQVEQLRTEMHSRFDRIDRTLNVIYQTLVERFNQIDVHLGQLTADVHEIQSALVDIEKNMHRFEKNMFDILSDGFRRPLWDSVNGCIGYQQRTGAVMPFQPDYVNCENVFQTWATIHAFDQVATGPSSRPINDDVVADELSKFPLDTNINYLAQFVSQRFGLPSFAPRQLANPRDWAIGGRAYAELAADWPDYALRINPARSTAIDNVGSALKVAMSNITTVVTPTGPQANAQYFDKAIANYNEKAAALNAAMFAVEAKEREDVRQGSPTTTDDDRHGLIDLWGGAAQALSPDDRPAPVSISVCGSGGRDVAAPTNLNDEWLPAPFPMARYLGLGSTDSCYSAEWSHIHSVKGRFFTTYIADLIVNITAHFGGATTHTRQLIISNLEMGTCSGQDETECTFEDAVDTASFNWVGNAELKAAFESGEGTITFDDPTLRTTATTAVTDRLTAFQQDLYQKIIAELTGTTEIAAAARRLTGATAVINALVTLGLPRALESDELLHAMIFGEQRLLDQDDEERITLLYASALQTPPDHNVREDMDAAIDGRVGLLARSIHGYVGLIAARKYSESQRLIATTLDRSRIAQSLVRTPLASLSASSVQFGRQFVGMPGAPHAVTLSNTALAAPLTHIAVSVSGTNTGDVTQTTTCGTVLAAGASCVIRLTFKPAAIGPRAATLTIVSDAPGSPQHVTLAGTGTNPAPQTNLVPNPGFGADANNDTRPDLWSIDPHVTRSTLAGHTGGYGMLHSATTDAGYTITSSPIMDLVAGAPYAVKAWVKIPTPSSPDANGFSFGVEVQWRNAANTSIGTTPIKTYTVPTVAAGDQAVKVVIPPVGTVSAVVRMVVVSLRGDVYVDDIVLGNLLANGGFELDQNGDGRPDTWNVDTHVTRSSLVRHDGAFAMRHAATDNVSYAILEAPMRIDGGRPYTLGGYVNIPATTDAFSFRLEVQWRDLNNAIVRIDTVKTYTAHTGGAWNLASGTYIAPVGATNARVRMVVGSLNGSIYVDSLVLRP